KSPTNETRLDQIKQPQALLISPACATWRKTTSGSAARQPYSWDALESWWVATATEPIRPSIAASRTLSQLDLRPEARATVACLQALGLRLGLWAAWLALPPQKLEPRG